MCLCERKNRKISQKWERRKILGEEEEERKIELLSLIFILLRIYFKQGSDDVYERIRKTFADAEMKMKINGKQL